MNLFAARMKLEPNPFRKRMFAAVLASFELSLIPFESFAAFRQPVLQLCLLCPPPAAAALPRRADIVVERFQEEVCPSTRLFFLRHRSHFFRSKPRPSVRFLPTVTEFGSRFVSPFAERVAGLLC